MAATKKAAKSAPKKSAEKKVIEAPSAELKEFAKKTMARDDMSNCEAIREIAKKHAKVPRRVIVGLLTAAPFNMKKGTVSTQIQYGRSGRIS